MDWIAYAEIDPFGGVRGDINAGVIAATIANVNRDPKKRRKAFAIEDFMPFLKQKPENLSDKIRRAMKGLKNGK